MSHISSRMSRIAAVCRQMSPVAEPSLVLFEDEDNLVLETENLGKRVSADWPTAGPGAFSVAAVFKTED